MTTAAQEHKPLRISFDQKGLETLAREVSVTFRPVWNVGKNYLCGYIIRPLKRGEDFAAADLGLLVRAAQALEELHARGEKSVVVVPVAFETLRTYPYRGHYLSMLRRIPEAIRSFVVLQLTDIPADAPKQRVLSLQSDVRGLCRALAMASDIRGGNLDAVLRGQMHACIIDFTAGPMDEQQLVNLLAGFTDKTSRVSCAAMADGVATKTALHAAVAAGFKYIAGAAVLEDQVTLGISRRHFALENARAS